MRTVNTLIRLGGCPGWFAGRTLILLVLSCCDSNYVCSSLNILHAFFCIPDQYLTVFFFLLHFYWMIFACQRLFNLISAKICLCNAQTINAQISTRIRTLWSCFLAARLKKCASFNFTGFPCGRLTVRTRAVKNRITLFYVTVCMCPVFRMAVNRTDKSRQKKNTRHGNTAL